MTIEESVFLKRYNKIIDSLKAADKIPYYKELFNEQGINIDNIKSYEDFFHLPILDKNTYRNNIFKFVPIEAYDQGFNVVEYKTYSTNLKLLSEYLKKFNLLLRTTSGSTGLPLEIIIHESDLHNAYFSLNKFRARIREDFFGLKFTWVWFENVRGYKRETDKYVKINVHGFQYYVYSISDDEFEKLVDFLNKENISWLIGSSSFLSLFSEFILKKDIHIKFSLVECQSEHLFNWQRELMLKAFNTNPINVYSSNEVHFIGATCDNNKLHILDDNVFVELIDNGFGKKEVLVTNIGCHHIPLIRYKIGDVGEWDKNGCDCGCSTSVLKLEEFRVNDMISLKNGDKLDYWVIADSIIHIKHEFKINFDQFQVIQEDYDHFKYFIRTDDEIKDSFLEKILAYLKKYFFEIFNYVVYIEVNFQKKIIHSYLKTKYNHFFNVLEHEDVSE